MRDEVSARAGEDVQLPCSVNREECGDYHSIKWYNFVLISIAALYEIKFS